MGRKYNATSFPNITSVGELQVGLDYGLENLDSFKFK
jgi:hypothetical protein